MAICPGLTDTKLVRSITPESEVTYRKEWIFKVLEDFQKVEEMQKLVQTLSLFYIKKNTTERMNSCMI